MTSTQSNSVSAAKRRTSFSVNSGRMAVTKPSVMNRLNSLRNDQDTLELTPQPDVSCTRAHVDAEVAGVASSEGRAALLTALSSSESAHVARHSFGVLLGSAVPLFAFATTLPTMNETVWISFVAFCFLGLVLAVRRPW